MKKLIKIIIAIILIGVGTTALFFGEIWLPEKLHNTVEATNAPTIVIDKSDEMYKKKVDQLKSELAEELKGCESPGDTINTKPVIADNNAEGTLKGGDIPSIGGFRFKVSTVTGYYKQMTGNQITPTEAVILALDYPRAKELAKFIIFETKEGDKGVDNWRTCAARLKLHSRVEAIKQLEQ